MATSQGKFSRAMRTGVLPTIAALVVTAVLIIERLQVDWTVGCSMVTGAAPMACGLHAMLAWLPAVYVFSLAHIIGCQSGRAAAVRAVAENVVKFLIFAMLPFVGFFGAYLFYVGAGAGILVSLTIIGLLIAPFAGAAGAGFVSGALLSMAAGPSLVSTRWSDHGRRIKSYGFASAIGGLIMFVGQSLVDPAFTGLQGAAHPPWFVASIALCTVAAASTLVWTKALKLDAPNLTTVEGPNVRWSFAVIVVAIIGLTATVHAAVRSETTVFGNANGLLAPIASQFRGFRSKATVDLLLGGMRFTAPRSLIVERYRAAHQRQEHTTLHRGTPKEVNASWTVTAQVDEWRLVPMPGSGNEIVIVADDKGGEVRELYCLSYPATHQTCEQSARAPRRTDETRRQRHLGDFREEAVEIFDGDETAALGIRYRAGNDVQWDPEEQRPRLYCRLILLAVTRANLSANRIIPCDVDWRAEAMTMRTYLEGMFK